MCEMSVLSREISTLKDTPTPLFEDLKFIARGNIFKRLQNIIIHLTCVNIWESIGGLVAAHA